VSAEPNVAESRYRGLRPFRPGVSGNPGGVPKKLRKVRKALEKLDDRCVERLGRLIDDEDPKVAVKALELWAKYRLPVPKETQVSKLEVSPAPNVNPKLLALLASLPVEGEG
jgi:hypothetical protein